MSSVRHADSLPAEEVKAGTGTTRQVLIGPDEGPNFAMRRFIMEPGGGMPMHTNTVEHEQYVLRGSAQVQIGDQVHHVKAGDVVYIPLQKALDLGESKIYVGGEVKSPGAYDYQPGLTALNACIMAGGFDKYAAPNRTRIIRKDGDRQETIKINLNDVKEGKIPDIELRPGDRIHVPETYL